MVEHVAIAPYHLRGNSQTEHFVDTSKRALKKTKGTPTDTVISKVNPNKNAPSDMTPAEPFARRFRSVFDKLKP